MAVKLDSNTRNWVADRVDNREPLMWGEFVSVMRENVYEGDLPKKILKKYRSKSYKAAVKRSYNRQRQLMQRHTRG